MPLRRGGERAPDIGLDRVGQHDVGPGAGHQPPQPPAIAQIGKKAGAGTLQRRVVDLGPHLPQPVTQIRRHIRRANADLVPDREDVADERSAKVGQRPRG